MIEPVNNRYQEYTRIDTQAGKMDNGEKFALDYKQEEEKERTKETDSAEKSGVVVELSGQSSKRYGTADSAYKAGETDRSQEELSFRDAVAGAQQFFGNLVNTITKLIRTVRESVLNFWNSDETVKETQVKETEIQNTGELPADIAAFEATHTKEPDPDSANYVDEIADYLDQNPQGTYVKNSDLLTYYDRQGRIVKLSGADRNRILKGDRNAMKG